MNVWRDFVYASRSLRKSPGFTAAAILILALAIGANTAIFSALEGVVLEPLPYRDPDRLVIMALYNRTLKSAMSLSYPDFLDWQQSSLAFEQIAAYRQQGFDLASPGEPEHVNGKQISSNFFKTLGVSLALGRELSAEEDKIAGPPAVIISDRLWRERFARSPSALGRTVTLNGADYAIVGVLKPGFQLDKEQTDLYIALGRGNPLLLTDRAAHTIAAIARLQTQVSLDQARAAMNAVQERINQLNPDERGFGVYVVPLKEFLVGNVSGTLLLLLGAVGLLLLIACANLANLLLARSAVRAREFAIRLALGASRAHIMRQLVSESVLFSLVGGALGVAIGAWGLDVALAAAPGSVPRVENIGMSPAVLLFAFGLSTAAGIVFGLLPAFLSSNTDLQTGLKDGGRGSAGGQQRTQRMLVILQIALTLVLMGRQRFPAVLLVAFAGLALVLACVGTYAVISYSTSQRRREMGIRMALGADRGHVFGIVIGQGIQMALIGVGIGISVTLILAKTLPSFSHLLYGVGASDPLTLFGTSDFDQYGRFCVLCSCAPCGAIGSNNRAS